MKKILKQQNNSRTGFIACQYPLPVTLKNMLSNFSVLLIVYLGKVTTSMSLSPCIASGGTCTPLSSLPWSAVLQPTARRCLSDFQYDTLLAAGCMCSLPFFSKVFCLFALSFFTYISAIENINFYLLIKRKRVNKQSQRKFCIHWTDCFSRLIQSC